MLKKVFVSSVYVVVVKRRRIRGHHQEQYHDNQPENELDFDFYVSSILPFFDDTTKYIKDNSCQDNRDKPSLMKQMITDVTTKRRMMSSSSDGADDEEAVRRKSCVEKESAFLFLGHRSRVSFSDERNRMRVQASPWFSSPFSFLFMSL